MISLFLTTLLAPLMAVSCPEFAPTQDSEPVAVQTPKAESSAMVSLAVGDLTGADELAELREAIVSDELPNSVRRASLDRYSDVLESGTVQAAADSLVDSIQSFVQPPPVGGARGFKVVALSPSEISVYGTVAQRNWVVAFLDALRASSGHQVLVEIEIYRLPTGSGAALMGERTGTTLTAAELEVVTAKIEALDPREKTFAPKVVMNIGSRANISVLDETAYIRDFELTALPDLAQEVADPVVDVIQAGISIDLSAVPVGEDNLMVRADFTSSALRRPMKEVQVKIGASGHEVTVQLPEVRKIQAAAVFEFAKNAAIVLSTVDPGFGEGAERDVVLVIRAKRLEDQPKASKR